MELSSSRIAPVQMASPQKILSIKWKTNLKAINFNMNRLPIQPLLKLIIETVMTKRLRKRFSKALKNAHMLTQAES
jgi:hypothetical protein